MKGKMNKYSIWKFSPNESVRVKETGLIGKAGILNNNNPELEREYYVTF